MLRKSTDVLFRLSGFLGALSVVAGAFGAHALKDRLSPASLAAFETGARYLMYHALLLGLLGLAGLLHPSAPRRALWLAGGLITVGTLLFSGSLFLLALTGERAFAWVTPIGGLGMIAGWCVLAFVRIERSSRT